MADCFSFNKGDVEAGGVVVDELKQEHLHRQAVLVVSHGPRELCCPITNKNDVWLNRALFNKKQKTMCNTNPPKSVIQMATRSYSMLRIMITTKLMMEAVTDVAI